MIFFNNGNKYTHIIDLKHNVYGSRVLLVNSKCILHRYIKSYLKETLVMHAHTTQDNT